MAGGVVKVAGEIKTDPQGNITEVSSKSGHYKPDKEELLTGLRVFKSQGVDLSKVRVVLHQKSGTRFYNNAEKFLELEGNLTHDGLDNLVFERNEEGKVVSIRSIDPHANFSSIISLIKQIQEVEGDLSAADFIKDTFWGNTFEYNCGDYLNKKRIPKKWSGGEIEKDAQGNIVKVTSKNEREENEFEALSKELFILDSLALYGVDLSKVEFVPYPGADMVLASVYIEINGPRLLELSQQTSNP